MDASATDIILALLGFLQAIYMFILAYLFKIQGTIFKKMDDNKRECGEKIDKNAEHDRRDKESLEKKMTDLLNEHYVTTGQLNTLEKELKGEIKLVVKAIENLTEVIREKLNKG